MTPDFFPLLTILYLILYPLSMLSRVKRKVEEYEYDEAMEPSYRKSMFKIFNKTLEDGFFPMVIVDAVNYKVSVHLKIRG